MKPTLLLSLLLVATPAAAADWPQWGGSPMRNNAPGADVGPLPAQWNVGRFDPDSGRWDSQFARNVRWVARLGTYTYGSPVIAGGSVFCGTNNGAGWLKGRPATIDAGLPALLPPRRRGLPMAALLRRSWLPATISISARSGVCSAPLVEGDRLWVVTNRCEVVCVDLGRSSGRQEAVVVWRLDMIGQLGAGAAQHEQLLADRRRRTAPGRHRQRRRSDAPPRCAPRGPPVFSPWTSDRAKSVWADSSPGQNILHGQWASPAFAPNRRGSPGDLSRRRRLALQLPPDAGGKTRAALEVRLQSEAVGVEAGGGGRPRHPRRHAGRCTATAIYIATGEDPEFGGGAQGRLWRIDARKRGDTSAELVFDKLGRPLPPRRISAADPAAGDVVRPNPNSAAVWQYVGDQGPKAEFKTVMHRTLGMAAIKDDLLVVADLAGVVHCLDVSTGKVHWTFDMMSPVWGSPLLADGKIFVGDEDGDVRVFRLSPRLEVLGENNMGGPVQTTPAAVNGILYIATRNHLFAIGKDPRDSPGNEGILPQTLIPSRGSHDACGFAKRQAETECFHASNAGCSSRHRAEGSLQ